MYWHKLGTYHCIVKCLRVRGPTFTCPRPVYEGDVLGSTYATEAGVGRHGLRPSMRDKPKPHAGPDPDIQIQACKPYADMLFLRFSMLREASTTVSCLHLNTRLNPEHGT